MTGSKNGSEYFLFFDVDARAELCRAPARSIISCPRLGEHVDFRSELERGGGVYLVVGVRHILEEVADGKKREAAMSHVIVELKPTHSAELEQEDAIAIEVPVEELAILDLPPEPTLN